MKLAIVGGGIFGCLASIELSKVGHEVTLFESSSDVLKNASEINQARLHTGMHYPRDFETAFNAKKNHDDFKELFPEAVVPIEQIYAVGKGSKINFSDFLSFGKRLGLHNSEIPCPAYLKAEFLEGVVRVPESTIDITIMRKEVKKLLSRYSVNLLLNESVNDVEIELGKPMLSSGNRQEVFDYLVVATYSTVDTFARKLGIAFRPTKKQLTEVVLCKIPELSGIGVTVMDGPFWSTMPYGLSGLHTLTSVVHTPFLESFSDKLDCQKMHPFCGRESLADCNSCLLRPASKTQSIIEHVKSFFRKEMEITLSHSMYTVKSLPFDLHSVSTDYRPTDIFHSPRINTILVHSGKIGSSIYFAKHCVNLLDRK
jgi:hypothetical protein